LTKKIDAEHVRDISWLGSAWVIVHTLCSVAAISTDDRTAVKYSFIKIYLQNPFNAKIKAKLGIIEKL
jgi:hypothetical protein